MNQNLLYLKIKVALAEMKINEVYNASEYLAQVILFLMVNHDDSKQCFKQAVDNAHITFNIAPSTITISIAKLLRNSDLSAYPEVNAFNDIYKKVVCLKHILQIKIEK